MSHLSKLRFGFHHPNTRREATLKPETLKPETQVITNRVNLKP